MQLPAADERNVSMNHLAVHTIMHGVRTRAQLEAEIHVAVSFVRSDPHDLLSTCRDVEQHVKESIRRAAVMSTHTVRAERTDETKEQDRERWQGRRRRGEQLDLSDPRCCCMSSLTKSCHPN